MKKLIFTMLMLSSGSMFAQIGLAYSCDTAEDRLEVLYNQFKTMKADSATSVSSLDAKKADICKQVSVMLDNGCEISV